MKAELTEFEANKSVAIRLPCELYEAARKQARTLDLSFSQIVRRALRRELENPAPDNGHVAMTAILPPGHDEK